MSDSVRPRDSAAVTGAASRPLADVLLVLSSAPQTRAALAVLWAGVLWLGTQVPQLHAPGMGTDGLARSEVLGLHALGLDQLAWSLTTWLLAGFTVFVALVWLVAARGALRTAPVLRVLALTVLLGTWLASTAGAPPVTLEIPVGDKLAQVSAWMQDGGGPGPAPGRWQGACRAHVGAVVIDCVLDGAGLKHQVTLAPGASVESQGMQLTWLTTGPAPLPKQMTLNWRAKPERQDIFALQLRDGESTAAPMLQATLQPLVVKEAGPLVLVDDGGSSPRLRLLASPDVLPKGRPTAQVVGEPMVRVQVAPARSSVPLAVACLVLASGFIGLMRQKSTSDAEAG